MAESSAYNQLKKGPVPEFLGVAAVQHIGGTSIAIDLYQLSLELLDRQWHGIKIDSDHWTNDKKASVANSLSQLRL